MTTIHPAAEAWDRRHRNLPAPEPGYALRVPEGTPVHLQKNLLVVTARVLPNGSVLNLEGFSITTGEQEEALRLTSKRASIFGGGGIVLWESSL
jgi:hypothetical protein